MNSDEIVFWRGKSLWFFFKKSAVLDKDPGLVPSLYMTPITQTLLVK